MIGLDLGAVIAGSMGSASAVYAASKSRKNARSLKTANGHSVGEYVEKTWYALSELQEQFITHIQDKEQHGKRDDRASIR